MAMIAGDHALVAPALAGRDQVTDDRHHADHQAAGAEALDGAEGDQLHHAVLRAAEHPEPAMPHSAEPTRKMTIEVRKTDLAAVQVTELAPDRGGDGGAQDVRGDHPGEVVEPAELADDPRQRGADDHVVEHREHHRDHQPEQHDP